MKYSIPIDIEYDQKALADIYWSQVAERISDSKNIKNQPSVINSYTAYLIRATDVKWPIDHIIEAFDIQVDTVKVFVTLPYKTLFVHRDKVANNETLRQWAINIPVVNGSAGHNQWFEDHNNDFGGEYVVYGGAAKMPQSLKTDFVVAESCVLDQVKLFRTDVMHRAVNDSDRPRVVLSIRSKENTSWDEISEKVHEYNKSRRNSSSA